MVYLHCYDDIYLPTGLSISWFVTDNLLRLTKMVKGISEFLFFAVFLKNRNIISKIKRSKVKDYAALKSIKHLPAEANSLINFVNSRKQIQVKMLGVIWIHTV